MQENHYKYFKELYDEEGKRTADLHDNAKVNITIVSLYAAFVGLTPAAHDKFSIHRISSCVFVVALICLFLSIMISLYTTRISAYQVPNYPRDVLNIIGSYDSDSAFYEDRAIDLVAAYEGNSSINDRKVDLLFYARVFLLLGVLSHFSYFMLALTNY